MYTYSSHQQKKCKICCLQWREVRGKSPHIEMNNLKQCNCMKRGGRKTGLVHFSIFVGSTKIHLSFS